jgi:hypothetical protein
MHENSLSSGDWHEEVAWAPSPALRQALGLGMWATLATGVVLIAESSLALLQEPAWASVVHGLGWAALVCGAWIVAAYVKLGLETGYRSLLKTSVCVFGALVLLQVFDLISLDVLPWIADLVLWIVLAVGLIVLAILPFALSEGAFGETEEVRALRAVDAADCSAASAGLVAGQRVLGNWGKRGTWYAAAVQSIDGGSFAIAYDDGDHETVTGGRVIAEKWTPVEELAIGDRVLARWWGGPCYYAGVVTEFRSGEVHICYDDGDTEWHKADVVRLRTQVGVASAPLPGDAPANEVGRTPKKGLAAKLWGAVGAIGVAGALILIRAVGKGVARFAARRGAPGANVDWLEVAGFVLIAALFLMLVIYFIWFAIAKIAAGSRLGGVAVLLGTAELLGLGFASWMAGWLYLQMAQAADRPGVNDEQLGQLEARLAASLVPGEVLLTVLWAALTIWLFASVRSRHDAAADLRAADELAR